MRRQTTTERQKARILKVARNTIRLRHSIESDEECNSILPELERKLDEATLTGGSYILDVHKLLEGKGL